MLVDCVDVNMIVDIIIMSCKMLIREDWVSGTGIFLYYINNYLKMKSLKERKNTFELVMSEECTNAGGPLCV